jgi:hypothetical protein
MKKDRVLLMLRVGALTSVLSPGVLTSTDAVYAKVDPSDPVTYNAFDCDTQRLLEIIEFGTKGYNVASGVIKIINFLTGLTGGSASAKITLQSIQLAGHSADHKKLDEPYLNEVQDHALTFNLIEQNFSDPITIDIRYSYGTFRNVWIAIYSLEVCPGSVAAEREPDNEKTGNYNAVSGWSLGDRKTADDFAAYDALPDDSKSFPGKADKFYGSER